MVLLCRPKLQAVSVLLLPMTGSTFTSLTGALHPFHAIVREKHKSH